MKSLQALLASVVHPIIVRTIVGITAAAGIHLQAHGELMAYWDFESPNRYQDRSGNGADGVAGNNVTADPDSPVGEAITIGVSGAVPEEIVTIAHDSFPVIGLEDFSFSFWARRDATEADSNQVDGIFDALGGTSQGFQALFIGNRFRLRMDEPGADFILADSQTVIPPDGAWHHFTVTVDRDNPEGLIIYIDGQLDSLHDPTPVSGTVEILSQDFWIGNINGSEVLGLDGSLDDLAFYSVVLSADQILNLAAQKSTPLTVFSLPLPPPLKISHDAGAGTLSIAWERRTGMLYNLRSAVDPSSAVPGDWPIFHGHSNIESTPPENTLEIALPVEREQFFVVEEFPAPPVTVFAENFDETVAGMLPAGWTTGFEAGDILMNTAWELGTPLSVGPVPPGVPLPSSPNCIGTNLAANYGIGSNIWQRTPGDIDLTDASVATLVFQQWVDMDDFDNLDRGTVRVLDGPELSGGTVTELGVVQVNITGFSPGGWREFSAELPASALGRMVALEFGFVSDDFADSDASGWYIDDVAVFVR